MVNFNGNIVETHSVLSVNNRGLNYGDAVFETIRVVSGTPLFFEDHYFRLMASMRIMRMEIPMNFTMEHLEEEVCKVLNNNDLSALSSRVKLIVFRKEGGLYSPINNEVNYLITASKLDDNYKLNESFYEVDLFKDHYVSPSLISTIKSNNKAVNVLGSIYAKENSLNNCLLLNTDKNIIEALNGNIFLVKDNKIKTPPIADGCLNGIMRKQLLQIVASKTDLTIEEASISPFELQKADELFITNVIVGIQPITKYRKKVYDNSVSKALTEALIKYIEN